MTSSDFNNLISLLSRKLYRYAYQFLKNQEESEDTVHEVFIKLWKMNEELDKYNSIDALAATMTRNYAIDQLRKRKSTGFEYDTNLAGYIDPGPTPQEQMERNETHRILDDIIQKLPEIYREIILLREIDGYSYEEIAEITSQSINNLRVTLSRARKMIRDEYKRKRYE